MKSCDNCSEMSDCIVGVIRDRSPCEHWEPIKTYGDSAHVECPECGELNADMWEVLDYDEDSVTETWCGSCNAELRLVMSVTYRTTCTVGHGEAG